MNVTRFYLQIFLICYFITLSESYDLASPEVFDPVFYVNNHHQIRQGIHTVEQAKHHWLTHGIIAGWQGSGQFHSKQYLSMYADLQKAFGQNFTAVIQHYLAHHSEEHRFGLVSTHHEYEGRWTIVKNGIYVSVSKRTGGAVDSLTWNNKEFVNSHDHGRQMQMACNTNTYTECYNPTEAGGRCDADKDTTHSHIDWIRISAGVMTSQNHPAFWKPVEPSSGTHHNCHYGSICPIRHGYRTTYDHTFSKKITIESHGIKNCIEFISNFTIGGVWPQDAEYIQMEAPAVYLTYEFTKSYTFNPQTRLAENYHSTALPVILATTDNQHALGGYAPPGQDTDRRESNNHHYFTQQNFASATSKFNIVFYKRPHGTSVRNFIYRTYLCVGTLNMVTDCLHQIMEAVPKR